jgi:hypothetical protein
MNNNLPDLSQEEIDILQDYGFQYDEEIGYLGIPQLGVGIYKRSLSILLTLT